MEGTGGCLGLVVMMHEYFGVVLGYDGDAGGVAEVDGGGSPFFEYKGAGALAEDHVGAAGGVVEGDVLVEVYEVAVEQVRVEVVADEAGGGEVVVDGEVEVALPSLYEALRGGWPLAETFVAGVEGCGLLLECVAEIFHD